MQSVEQTEMDKITTELAEFFCDNLCKYPMIVHDQELLDNCCAECPMGKYICDILNAYSRINNFEKSQSYHLLQKIAELEARLNE